MIWNLLHPSVVTRLAYCGTAIYIVDMLVTAKVM